MTLKKARDLTSKIDTQVERLNSVSSKLYLEFTKEKVKECSYTLSTIIYQLQVVLEELYKEEVEKKIIYKNIHKVVQWNKIEKK